MPEPRLSLGRAWDETAALARRRGAPLFAAAFLLLSLPAAVVQALAPVTAPGGMPAAGLWLALLPELIVAGLAGALAVSRLALEPEARLDAAVRATLRRLPALLVAALLLCAGAGLLAAAASLAPGQWSVPVWLAGVLLIWPRLVLVTPAAAAEAPGPLGLIARSWRLTRGLYLRLLATLALVLLLSFVVLAATGALAGILIVLALGRPEPGGATFLLILGAGALVQAPVSGLFTAFVARIYAQLAGRDGG